MGIETLTESAIMSGRPAPGDDEDATSAARLAALPATAIGRAEHAPERAASRAQFSEEVMDQAFARLPLAILFDPELSAGAKVAWAALAWYAYKRTDLPSQYALARELGIGRRTWQRHIAELCDRGHVRAVRPGRNGPVTYVVTTAADPSRAPDSEHPPAPSGAPEVRHERRADGVMDGAPRIQEGTSQELPQEVGHLVAAFFESLGEDIPSRERRESAVDIIANLTEQGYPAESLMEAIDLAAERGARGPQLLPHVVGEAHQRVIARRAATEEEARRQAALVQRRDEESDQLRAEIAEIEALPRAEYRRLLALARKRLPHGVSEAMERRLLPGLLVAVRRREAEAVGHPDDPLTTSAGAAGPNSGADSNAMVQVCIDPPGLGDRAVSRAVAAVELR